MHGNLPAVGQTATNSNSASGSDCETASGLGSDNSDWFGAMARPLLGKEPGVALHYITGFSPSTCAKYVAKTEASRRQPPGFFVRELIRREQGEPFFLALMDGCTAQWWLDMQRNARIGAAVMKLTERE